MRRLRAAMMAVRWPLVASMWVAAVIAGLVILLTPELHKRPLLRSNEWKVEGAFARDHAPSLDEVSAEFSRNPADYWRSWSCGTEPCQLTSAPFTAPRYLAVPFVGYPAERGIELFLECIDTGARLALARGNVHENWTERTLRLPRRWCASQVRLAAVDKSSLAYVGLGSPYESNALAWLKESSLVAVAIHAMIFTLLLAPGAALLSFVPQRTAGEVPTPLLYVPLSLLLGYAGFFVVYWGGKTGQAAMLAAVLALLFLAAVRGRRIVHQITDGGVSRPLLTYFLLSLAFVLFLYSADNGLGTWAGTYRYEPAVWSSDNQLPQLVAEGVAQGRPAKGLFGASKWRVSDRPPLMSGALLLQRPLWQPFLALGNNKRLTYLFHQIAGIILSTLWVLPVWFLGRDMGPRSDKTAALVVLLVATTGFATLNSTYVWPKMLAGALGLLALRSLATTRRDSGSRRPGHAALAGLLAGMALLSHGGVVFGLVPVFAARFLSHPRTGFKVLLVSAVTALALLAPWFYWQRVEDPPGNALVKSALAGTYGWDDENRSLLATVAQTYRDRGFRGWLETRIEACQTLAGARTPDAIRWVWTRDRDLAGHARLAEFLFLLPTLGLANAGWILLATRKRLGASTDSPSAESSERPSRYIFLGVLGIGLDVTLAWSNHVTHEQSYLSVLLLFVGLYGVILSARSWLKRFLIAFQLTYFLAVWVWSPFTAATLRPDFALALTVVSSLLVVTLWHWSRLEPVANASTPQTCPDSQERLKCHPSGLV